MIGPVPEGRGHAASQPERAPLRGPDTTGIPGRSGFRSLTRVARCTPTATGPPDRGSPPLSTRALIFTALLCGLAILVAFTVQVFITR